MQTKKKNIIYIICGALMSIFAFVSCAGHKAQEKDIIMNEKSASAETIDTATFGTGCFWCTEAIFQRLEGVVKVISGYSGGNGPVPTYEEVCTGKTGFAEACQIVYDPSKITFDQLLEVFWKTHDPTTLNRQGNDVGTQYRSVIFYHNDLQKAKAEHYKAVLDTSGSWNKPIVTSIELYRNFYSAENYHQDYYNNNKEQMYCQFVIRPKLEKFEKVFKDELKKQETSQ
jgi:peptide-methionine (S)-S-oxide reductase